MREIKVKPLTAEQEAAIGRALENVVPQILEDDEMPLEKRMEFSQEAAGKLGEWLGVSAIFLEEVERLESAQGLASIYATLFGIAAAAKSRIRDMLEE